MMGAGEFQNGNVLWNLLVNLERVLHAFASISTAWLREGNMVGGLEQPHMPCSAATAASASCCVSYVTKAHPLGGLLA